MNARLTILVRFKFKNNLYNLDVLKSRPFKVWWIVKKMPHFLS